MKLYIKDMKDAACSSRLADVLTELQMPHTDLELGEVELSPGVSQAQVSLLKEKLHEHGWSIIYDRRSILTEKIKHVVYNMLANDTLPLENYSKYISNRLFLNYTYLANVFSETDGMTIEHFIINHKIEKVKQLFQSTDLTVSNIADIMHYSSVGHLSNQFKKVTGLNPSEYKKQLNGNFLN